MGDTVTVGETGDTVSRIRVRATTITDWDRRELILPNKEFITGKLINRSFSDPILRIKIPLGIAYGSDTDLAEKLLPANHALMMVVSSPLRCSPIRDCKVSGESNRGSS